MTRLTKTIVERLPAPSTGYSLYWDSQDRGFGVRVTREGKRSYVIVLDSSADLSPYPRGRGLTGAMQQAPHTPFARNVQRLQRGSAGSRPYPTGGAVTGPCPRAQGRITPSTWMGPCNLH